MRATVAIPLLLLLGCSPASVTFPATAPTPNTPVVDIAVKPINAEDLGKVIEGYNGKVVLIDIWFLGCAPCVKKFPEFVELHRLFNNEGLVNISLNVYPEELKITEKVLAFLKKHEATFPNFIFDDTEANRDKWQTKYDAIATPSQVLFNRKGERVPIPEKLTPEGMRDFVKKQLDAK